MYTEIIQQIKELLEGVVIGEVDGNDKYPDVYAYPLGEGESPDNYPTIIFFPTDFNNEFQTSTSEYKELNFSVFVIMNAEQISKEDLFTYSLPNVADKVIQEIDLGWDFGRTDNNKRIWARADVGTWGSAVEESGETAFIDINLIIKLETN